jgi:hypothetical protein
LFFFRVYFLFFTPFTAPSISLMAAWRDLCSGSLGP